MYIGLNYINGDFLPHRPEFSAEGGIFPRATTREYAEAEYCCKEDRSKWISLGFEKQMDIVSQLWEDFDSYKFQRKNLDKDFLYLNFHEYFNDFCHLTDFLLSGYSVIIVPRNNRIECQDLVSKWNRISIVPGVVNLLHTDGY